MHNIAIFALPAMYTKKSMEDLGRLQLGNMAATENHRIIVILDDVHSMYNLGSAFPPAILLQSH